MKENRHYVIDFDSTFTQVEALDVLGEISLKSHPEKDQKLHRLTELTDLAMAGKIGFRESLEKRLEILEADMTPRGLIIFLLLVLKRKKKYKKCLLYRDY